MIALINYIQSLFRKNSIPASKMDLTNAGGIESVFRYTNDGFSMSTSRGERFYRWSDIYQIAAYKEDFYTYDDIRIDIEFENVVLTLSEDEPGWCEFTEVLHLVFPSIAKDWESEIVHPPFVRNWTLIYKNPCIADNGG